MHHILPKLRLAAIGLCLLLPIGPALAQQQGRPPAAVTVVTVNPQAVALTTTLPGRVVASAKAEVRPQVAGIIVDQRFQEGSRVEEGDVLFTIDAATYRAAVAQAEANVALALAKQRAADKEYSRFEELSSRNVASAQALDAAIAERDSAAAALQSAQAQLQLARIELDRTDIRARLSGEIGRSLTSPGALVTAAQSDPLAVIRTIDPVYVDVTQSASEMLDWRRGNTDARLGDTPREVTLTLADGTEYEHKGTLKAAEPDVDEQTGVVVLRMQFANPDKLLLPGMYVQVEMPTGTVPGAYLVPQEAVSRDRRGQPTALVVNAENIVEPRQLTVLQDRGNLWIVSAGLAPGDRVVVAGLQKAAPGATVAPEERAAEPSQGATGEAGTKTTD